MICVIKHKKSGKYLSSATSKLRVVGTTGGMLQQEWVKGSDVKFSVTDNINEARLIEDPDFDKVKSWGCEVIPVKSSKTKVEPSYRIIEHD